jgi:hypothetical protein
MGVALGIRTQEVLPLRCGIRPQKFIPLREPLLSPENYVYRKFVFSEDDDSWSPFSRALRSPMMSLVTSPLYQLRQ